MTTAGLIGTEELLAAIAEPGAGRVDIAVLYALALRQQAEQPDWAVVNRAIIERWSMYALKWIKQKAWHAVS